MPRGSSGTTTRLRWCTSPTCTGSWAILWSWTGFKCTRSGSSRGAELMGILGFIARRLLLAVPVFVGVTLVTFVLMQIVPGDPVAVLMEENVASVDPDAARIIRAKWGRDDPVPLQYLKFLRNAVRGDLGISYRTDRSVLASILERVPATATLAVAALGLAILIGVATGIIAALRQNTMFDSASIIFATIGVSIPNFWLGLLLIYLLAVQWRWLPPSGYGPAYPYLIMPAITLGTALSAVIARLTRSSTSPTSCSTPASSTNEDAARTDHSRPLRVAARPEAAEPHHRRRHRRRADRCGPPRTVDCPPGPYPRRRPQQLPASAWRSLPHGRRPLRPGCVQPDRLRRACLAGDRRGGAGLRPHSGARPGTALGILRRLGGQPHHAAGGDHLRLPRAAIRDCDHGRDRPKPVQRVPGAGTRQLDRAGQIGPGPGADHQASGVRGRGARAGRQQRPDHRPAHPSQRGGSGHRVGHARHRQRDPG